MAQKKARSRKKGKKREIIKGPETEVTQDVLEFIRALDDFKRTKNRPFPTWSEVLEVLKQLGYRKAAEGGGLPAHTRKTNPGKAKAR